MQNGRRSTIYEENNLVTNPFILVFLVLVFFVGNVAKADKNLCCADGLKAMLNFLQCCTRGGTIALTLCFVPSSLAACPGLVYDQYRTQCESSNAAFASKAQDLAMRNIRDAISLRERNPSIFTKYSIKWFGTKNSSGEDAIINNLSRVLALNLATTRWCINKSFPDSSPNDVAFVFQCDSHLEMFLEQGFFHLNQEGFDTGWGAILHEMVHLVDSAIVDHAYGTDAALGLAKTNPTRAIQNADNYEYFVEEIMQRD